MAKFITTDMEGWPEVQKLLMQLQGRELQNRLRRGTRAAVAVFRGPMRQKGANSRYPRKFRKTRTRPHRNPVGTSISPQSPLSTVFEHGARPHAIPIHKGPLAGRTVQHPGMAARPLSGPIFDEHQREAEEAFVRVTTMGLGPR